MVIAQHRIRQQLEQQLAEGRVPHAQLFCGPEGCGKLAVAIEYAQRLLCHGADERGQRMAALLQHPDLHFVFPVYKPEGQSSAATSDQFLNEWRELLGRTHYFDLPAWMSTLENIKARRDEARDEARAKKAEAGGAEPADSKGKKKGPRKVQIYTEESDAILHKLSLVSSQGGYKVMIIWLPELMHPACSNKILKILEEPPQQTVFILVSNHAEQLLDTIVSRCQRIEFKALREEEIAEALVEQRGLDADTARFVSHAAAGSYTRALQQLSRNDDESEFFTMFVLLMRKCYQRDIKQMRDWSEHVAGWSRERQKTFLDYCQRLIRENFIYNFHKPELNFMTKDESDFSVNFARFVNERNVIGIMDELSMAQRDIEQNVNAKMVFFDFALKMIVLLIS